MNSYSIVKQEPIVVYGGGQIGITIAQRLIKANYNVVAILDQNPNGIKNSPVIVMKPEDYFEKKGDSFVFISLGNGIPHTAVAKKLRIIGFNRILFLPLFLRSLAAKNMILAWNTFLGGVYDIIIPSYDELWNVFLNDFIKYEDSAGFVIVIVHKDHVRRNKNIINDNPFLAYLRPPTQGFRYPDTPLDNIEMNEYFEKIRPFSNELINFLQNALFFDASEFFTYSTPPATLNEEGYFNLIDGHHRCVFLVSKGFKGIPLRIKKSEWEIYFKEREAQALMNCCKELDSLPFAVKHPAFIAFPVEEREPDEEFVRLYKGLSGIKNG